MKFRTNSITFRLAAGAGLLLTVGMIVGAILLSSLFRSSVERGFNDYLAVMLEGLISVSEVRPDGTIELRSGSSDPRFQQPFSGWYWQINRGDQRLLRSASLWDATLPMDSDPDARLHYFETTGPDGQALRVVSRVIQFNEYPDPFLYVVAGDRSELEEEIAAFNRTLYGSLGVLGLVLFLSVFLQIRFGLLPLRRVPDALARIRSGKSDRLTGSFPSEVEPLAREINALLDHNAAVVERARTHVGNLAHALKTPLSVLTNEAASKNTRFAGLVGEQTALMREQVDHHLSRARAAARAGVLGARTSVMPVLDALKRTLEAIHKDRNLSITVSGPDDAAFRGERQDLEEMLGNLMDNACKWCRSKVAVTLTRVDGVLEVRVEDDGAGLSPADRRRAQKRGTRLDETAPGSGLGLAIVADLAGLYEGGLTLEEASLGGLAAILTLPEAEAEPEE